MGGIKSPTVCIGYVLTYLEMSILLDESMFLHHDKYCHRKDTVTRLYMQNNTNYKKELKTAFDCSICKLFRCIK